MANPFAESQLDLGILYGTNGGPRFKSEINENAAGYEQRILRWNQPKGRWTLGNKRLTRDELDYLHTFFQNRQGSHEGFRFKDWSDFSVSNQNLATIGSGFSQQSFQLFKTYRSAGVGVVKRKTTKPVDGTIRIYFDGVEVFNYVVDLTTGVVTFDSVPSEGTVITIDFEFDTPVRFEQDNFTARFIAYSEGEQLWELSEVSLIETRIETDSNAYFNNVDSNDVDFSTLKSEQFNLNRYTTDQAILYETVGGSGFKTEINEIGSGFERRDRAWEDQRASFNLGGMRLNSQEWEYLRDFFYARRGRGVGFIFSDLSYYGGQPFQARFDQDELDVTFIGYDPYDGEKLFDLSGLKIKELSTATEGRGYNGLMGDALTRATVWRIDRFDGVTLGFTDHDQDLDINGVTYRASTGASAFATSRKSNLSKDSSSLESILDSDSITQADILGDKYEGAKITIASVDYLALPATIEDGLVLLKGEIGQIEADQYSYKAEISGIETLLTHSASVPSSPLCDATFGDGRCKKDLAPLTDFVNHQDSSEPTKLIFPDGGISLSIEQMEDGTVIAVQGDNTGFQRDIRKVEVVGSNIEISFFEAFPFPLNEGSVVQGFDVVSGCNKTFASCKFYNNIDNFRAIPTLGNFAPNSDWMLAPKEQSASESTGAGGGGNDK